VHSDADPSTDGTGGLIAAFMAAVAVLAEGELTFPAPFDLATSAALSDNVDEGLIAQRLFDVSVERECRYRVSIHELAPSDRPDAPSRALLDTTVQNSQLLLHLLDDLSSELQARRHH
jgi:hypothetical protein